MYFGGNTICGEIAASNLILSISSERFWNSRYFPHVNNAEYLLLTQSDLPTIQCSYCLPLLATNKLQWSTWRTNPVLKDMSANMSYLFPQFQVTRGSVTSRFRFISLDTLCASEKKKEGEQTVEYISLNSMQKCWRLKEKDENTQSKRVM